MWVAPWRKVGVSVLLAALAVSVYVAARSGPVPLGVSSFEEPVGPPAVVRPFEPVATTLVRPSGVVPAGRGDTNVASSVNVMSTAIRSALSAWSEFVGSGDMTVLDADFEPEGPQHRLLVSEVPRLVETGSRPRFDLVGVRRVTRTDTTDTSALVDTWIVLVVEEGKSVLRWRFHLRRHGGRWRVWTIEELAGRDPSSAPE